MRQWFVPISNEIRKGLILEWGYRVNLLGEMLLIGVMFVGLNFLIGQGELERGDLQSTLIGYILWFYAEIAISHVTWHLREETQTGTLEQLMMSPTPPVVLIMARAIANFITTTIMVVVIGGVLSVVLGLDFPLRLSALPIFILTLLGLFGFMLSIAALTLLYKQIEAFSSFVQTILLFLNGALISVSAFPAVLEVIAKCLPTTLGIIALRDVLLEEVSLGDLWQSGDLPLLLGHTLASIIIGIAVFQWGERLAKQRGTLGRY